MGKSAVAGILSLDGGLRTVVTQRWRMASHVKRGERLFVVPNLLVDEPVPFNGPLMADCIQSVHRHVAKALAPQNPCGECRACCVTLYIDGPGFDPPKPSHTACNWCDSEVGCAIHWSRPQVCRQFECDWLRSQKTNRIMGPELRPDRCGVIFTRPGEADLEAGDADDLLYVHPTIADPDAHTREPVQSFIREGQDEGLFRARLVTHYRGEPT